jgi:hypothetical protein
MRRRYNWRAYFASLAEALGRQYVRPAVPAAQSRRAGAPYFWAVVAAVR